MREKEPDAIVVFTAKSPERIVQEGGSQSWKLKPAHAKLCTWLVCTQNRHHANHEFSDATKAHGAGFLLGRISGVRESEKHGDRWLIVISEYARIDVPDLWDHGRNPVRYTSLAELGINPDELSFHAVPGGDDGLSKRERKTTAAATTELTIADAKRALAATYGVKPEAIEITIRG